MWLVTGGAGYIGAHVVEETSSSGRELLVLDDLSTGVASRLSNKIQLVRGSLQD
jgi:UDP-glucose 4-epimerase